MKSRPLLVGLSILVMLADANRSQVVDIDADGSQVVDIDADHSQVVDIDADRSQVVDIDADLSQVVEDKLTVADRARVVGGDGVDIPAKATAVMAIAADAAEYGTSFFDEKSTSKVLKLLQQAPVLGVAAGIVSMVAPDSTAAALNKIQNQLSIIDVGITSLEYQIDDLKKDIALRSITDAINNKMAVIAGSEVKYRTYLKNVISSEGAISSFLDYFVTDKQDTKLENAVMDVFHYANGNPSVFQAVYDKSLGNLTAIEEMYSYLQSKITSGIMIHTLSNFLEKLDVTKVYTTDIEAECLQNGNDILEDRETLAPFVEKFNQYASKCKEEVQQNLQTDVRVLLAKFRDKDVTTNKMMADKIHQQITSKYRWFDFTVIVYDEEANSDKEHSFTEVTMGNSFSIIGEGMRNVVILAGNKVAADKQMVGSWNGIWEKANYRGSCRCIPFVKCWCKNTDRRSADTMLKRRPTAYFVDVFGSTWSTWTYNSTYIAGMNEEDKLCYSALVIKDGDKFNAGYKLGQNGDFSFGGEYVQDSEKDDKDNVCAYENPTYKNHAQYYGKCKERLYYTFAEFCDNRVNPNNQKNTKIWGEKDYGE